MLPAISVNKGCCSHQAITLQLPQWWAEPRIEIGCLPSRHQPLRPPPPLQRCTLRRLRMRKHRILAPDSWGAHQRNDFSEPRLLHLPIHRKVLSSLTWDVRFSFINSNLLMFRLPGLCCKNSSISWLLPDLFGTISQRGYIPGFKFSVLSAK